MLLWACGKSWIHVILMCLAVYKFGPTLNSLGTSVPDWTSPWALPSGQLQNKPGFPHDWQDKKEASFSCPSSVGHCPHLSLPQWSPPGRAHSTWRHVPLEERYGYFGDICVSFVKNGCQIAQKWPTRISQWDLLFLLHFAYYYVCMCTLSLTRFCIVVSSCIS